MEGVGFLFFAPSYVVVLAGCCWGVVHLLWSLSRSRRAWLPPHRHGRAATRLARVDERQRIVDCFLIFAIFAMIAPGIGYLVAPVLLVVPVLGSAVIRRVSDIRGRRPSGANFWPVVAFPAVVLPIGAFVALLPWLWPGSGAEVAILLALAAFVLAGTLGFAAAVLQLRMLERHDREVRDRYLEVVRDSGTEAWASGDGEGSTGPTTEEAWVANLFDRPRGVGGESARGGEHGHD